MNISGRALVAVPLAGVMAWASPARADDTLVDAAPSAPIPETHRWVAFEAPYAVGLGSGMLPAVTYFLDNGMGALGARFRGGVLATNENMDHRTGIGVASFALRRTVSPFWFEIGGGAAVTAGGIDPAIDLAVGVAVSTTNVRVGPSLRYLRVQHPADDLKSYDAMLVGIEISYRRPTHHPRVALQPHPSLASSTAPAWDPDAPTPTGDDAQCQAALDRAIDAGQVSVTDDRFVIDAHALFDPTFETATLSTRGRRVLTAIAHRWQSSPEWESLRVEAFSTLDHDDMRNWQRSASWASTARHILVGEQLSSLERVESIGYGRMLGAPLPFARIPNRIEVVIKKTPPVRVGAVE